jgi:hypothetical protein
VDDGRRSGHGRLDAQAGPQVCGEECDDRRNGPVVPGKNTDVAAADLQPGHDMPPEAAGATSNEDRRGHGSPYANRPSGEGTSYARSSLFADKCTIFFVQAAAELGRCHIGEVWTVSSMTGWDKRM